MNRRNILRGVAQSNLSAPPAALISHAVLCYTFAVSLSIIHETQIPFTFFQDFLKKVFGGDGKPHRHCFAMPPVRVAAPSVHIVQSTRVLLAAAPTTPPCFRHWRRSSLLPTRGGLGKEVRLCEMPRAPLLAGAVAAGDWGVAPSSCCRKTPPSSLRDATAPNRGGLGKEVELHEMPRAPLLAGAVAARRLGGSAQATAAGEPHRHPFGMPPPLIGAALAKRLSFTKCQGPPY